MLQCGSSLDHATQISLSLFSIFVLLNIFIFLTITNFSFLWEWLGQAYILPLSSMFSWMEELIFEVFFSFFFFKPCHWGMIDTQKAIHIWVIQLDKFRDMYKPVKLSPSPTAYAINILIISKSSFVLSLFLFFKRVYNSPLSITVFKTV